jgi:hypothetical protein
VTIEWKPPADDGGLEISKYSVEKCDVQKMVWMKVKFHVYFKETFVFYNFLIFIRDRNRFLELVPRILKNLKFFRVLGTGSGKNPKFEEPVPGKPKFVKRVPEPVPWNP